MLPRHHHFLSLVPNRVQAAIRRLEDNVWKNFAPVDVAVTEATPGPRDLAAVRSAPLQPAAAPQYWGRLFDQRWCRLRFPAGEGKGASRFLNWRDQGEATLYIGGKPRFGFDVAHRFCELPEGVGEAWMECHCVQSGIWVNDAQPLARHGSLFDGAFLCERDETAWHALHDLQCLMDVLMVVRGKEQPGLLAAPNRFGLQPGVVCVSPLHRQLLRSLDLAIDAFDQRGEAALREELAGVFALLRSSPARMTVILTGHAHIDLVWLWPERIGVFKAAHTFATANYLMERYPEFRFAYSQPASYEAVKRSLPKLYADVAARIASGRWQATGAMYVESDTMLACGEALGRGFVLGQAGFREINARPSPLCWLPDVFGYSACLPQIMRLNGVRFFFTTKMTWNAINRFPHSSFIWRGNDGSEILTHVSQEIGYNNRVTVGEIQAGAWNHQQSDVHCEFLMPTGYGDGGGGVTDEMCERARRLGALADLPEIAWDHPEQFFERLDKQRVRLPVHQGECYLEYHRGTFTTHGDLKAGFRALERALQIREAVACASGEAPDLAHAWKRLVFAQFHDYIPGSSVLDVYREGLPELARLRDELDGQARAQLAAAVGSSAIAVACVFNPHPLKYHGWVFPVDSSEPRYVELAPLGGGRVGDAQNTPRGVELVTAGGGSAHVARNGLAEFRLNKDGHIERLEWEGETVPQTDALGRLMLYPDHTANFDAWDIDRQTLSLGRPCDAPATIGEWKPDRSRSGFSVRRPLGKSSQVEVRFYLVAGSPLLHVDIDLDWREPEHLLKLLMPSGYAGAHARFGTPFGTVLRPQIARDATGDAMWEVPFSRHLAVFDDGERRGIFLATEAKYGATVRDGTIGLSLVRSPRVTGFESHRNAWVPELSRIADAGPFSDIGRHTIRLVFGRHAIDLPRERQPAAVAETIFTPPVAYEGAPFEGAIREFASGDTLIPAWAQPLGKNAWLLRLHEVAGQRGRMDMRLNAGWRAALCDFAGNAAGSLETGGEVACVFKPYEIVSVRIERG